MNENKARSRLDQRRAPIYEALERFRQMRVVPFDVPGHKRGRGNPELTAFLGQQCVGVDVNSMKPLDNLCHPVSVIREAEELAADAFGAAHAFLMVGGTTSSVQSMVLTACKRGDEIILPRNVHRSVLNALVLCGAVPVYVNPEVDKRLGISLGMKREQVEKAIKEHPNAVAVLVNNANYISHRSEISPDGYEKLVQVNFLSTVLLSLLIRPLMIEGGRIIFSTSLSHTPVSIPYEFPAVSNFMPIAAYAQSKMALSLFSIYLSTVLRTQHVAVNSVDSGLVNLSKLGMNRFISRFSFISNHTGNLENGAKAMMRAIGSADTGFIFKSGNKQIKASSLLRNREVFIKLCNDTMRVLKKQLEEPK